MRTASPGLVWAWRIGAVLAGSLVMVASAQIPGIPMWPVPVTLQTLAIPVLVALLGRELGTAAVAAYVFEGLIGLPVFQGGLGGPARFVGPLSTTAGYIVAFPIAAWLVGELYARGLRHTYAQRFAATFLGTGVVLILGPLWLAANFTHDLARAFAVGALPFLAGDVAKCLIAAAVTPLGFERRT